MFTSRSPEKEPENSPEIIFYRAAFIEESDMPSWIWRAGEEMPALPAPTLSSAKPTNAVAASVGDAAKAAQSLDAGNAAAADAAGSSTEHDSAW